MSTPTQPAHAHGTSARRTTVDIDDMHATANAQPYRSLEMLLIHEAMARARMPELVPAGRQPQATKRPARLVAAAAARLRERV